MDANLLNSSDDDFLVGMNAVETGTIASLATEGKETEDNTETNESTDTATTEHAETETTTGEAEHVETETKTDVAATEEATTVPVLDPNKETETEVKETKEVTDKEKEALAKSEPNKEKTDEAPFDYEAAYKKITAPFKANGKDIVLKSPEEVISMMQMGANYTRKMQSIAPHRKALMMLQNNDLLDESKLAFLIDLNKKDPSAIQKLLKDSGVDPLEVDVNAESTYQPGNHHISDEQVALTTVLEDVASTQEGRETVQIISSDWDQASKDALMTDPNIITVINQQRQNGVYDAITAEIERQKVIGAIPVQTSFLEAYRVVGTQLFGNASKETKAPLTPVARTIPTPTTAKAPNTEKIQATAPAKSIGKPNVKNDPLNLSDDEFMKLMEKQV